LYNVDITVSPSKLGEIAQLENVFAIEERGLKRRLDEAQGQILAGNLSGNVPTGPGYLTFLSNKGFTSSQFGSFVVEVVDDATSITEHPDLPTTRSISKQPDKPDRSAGRPRFLEHKHHRRLQQRYRLGG